jgi:tetratricopeptide (TPR) repeat protein
MPETDFTSVANSFVGRGRELGELRRALDEAKSGRGRLFLISGEPGIGKTRLADELAAEAASRGIRVVWGRCWEGGGAPGYWPWIQVIRGCINSAEVAQRRSVLESEHASSMVETVAQIVPELRAIAPHSLKPAMTPRPAPEQTQFRLFDSVATLLKDFARLQPLLIILDDLHDADYSSLKMLRLITQGLAGADILIVGTHREVEVRRSPELSKHIGDLSREARCIPLTGLSQAEVAQFVSLSSGQTPDDKLVAKLCASTDGNPLFVNGIVRLLLADGKAKRASLSDLPFTIPDGVRAAIRLRVDALSKDAVSLLSIAAVLGKDFEVRHCQPVAGLALAKINRLLDEAATAGIVTPLGQGRYRFSHALIRDAVYVELKTEHRASLHRKVGEAIEEIHGKDLASHLAELAHHFSEGGITEKAINYSIRAGKAAHAVFAYDKAVSEFEAALELTKKCATGDTRQAEILFELGSATCFFVDKLRGVAHLETALELYNQAGDELRVAEIHGLLGLAFGPFAPQMNVARALDHFERAEPVLSQTSETRSLGLLYWGLAMTKFEALRIDDALAASERAMDICRRLGDERWASVAGNRSQYLMIKGKHAEARSIIEKLKGAATGLTDPEVFKNVMWCCAWYHGLMGDPREAIRLHRLGLKRSDLTPFQRALLLEFVTIQEVAAGNLAQAKALAAENRVNRNFRSQIVFYEGDWKSAQELLEEEVGWARNASSRWNEVNSLRSLMEVLRIEGDLDGAAACFSRARGLYASDDLFWDIRLCPQAVFLLVDAGRPEEAHPHLQRCREILGQGENWLGSSGAIWRAEAMVAAATGQFREADTHFATAVEIFKRYCLPWAEAETLHYWGLAFNKAGEYSPANEKFDGAIDIYRRHGAGQRWIDRTEAARPSLAAATTSQKLAEDSSDSAIFQREGDFWTITHRGNTFRLRNFKGLSYIAYLLAHPGVRVHVCDLVAIVEGGATQTPRTLGQARADGLEASRDLGDAGETLDPRAIAEYRIRLAEVREELAEAERNNDSGAVDRARRELGLLTSQLTAGVGVGGRLRRSSSHVERARALVTKNIRASVEHIRRNDLKLAEHFATSIRTGAFCAYLPAAERIGRGTSDPSLPS